MEESIGITTKTAIKYLGDQSSLASWISEHKDTLHNVKINTTS